MKRQGRDEVGFHVESGPEIDLRPSQDERPFHIALVGDWSRRRDRGPILKRRPVAVDRDSFDAVLRKLAPRIDTPAGEYVISDLDDFHPDTIYKRLPVFASLRNRRSQLSNPVTSARAAEEVLGPSAAPLAPRSAATTSGDLLEDILTASETGLAAASAKRAKQADRAKPVDEDLQEFVRKAVQPHLTPRQDARAADLIRDTDTDTSELMRAFLRSADFRSAEAAWRTLFQLVRRLETGPDLSLFLIDVSKDEAAAEPEHLAELLIEGSGPWAVLAANYSFGADDTKLLSILGRIAKQAGAPVLGEADLSLIDNEAWNEFRRSAEARYVALALPRILLRLPYGAGTSRCETFDFEEISGRPESSQLLYGNPAPYCAMLLGQSFESEGWNMRPGSVRDIDDLPVYTFKEDDEVLMFPCAETTLTESTAEALSDAGFIPMAHLRGTDVVRAVRMQPVSDPPQRLPGRWS